MRRVLAFGLLSAASAVARASAPPSYCAEWVRQSQQGYERLTLFANRELVWKTKEGEKENVQRKTLDAEEAKFYCDYFAREDFWSLPDDYRSGVKGEFLSDSSLRLTRPDGSVKEIRFDELSALSSEASAARASLEGLKRLFTERIAPASRFAADKLPPGTVLKRFDGEFFRVRMVDAGKGVVELEAISGPFSFFRKIEDLRFFFHPPGE